MCAIKKEPSLKVSFSSHDSRRTATDKDSYICSCPGENPSKIQYTAVHCNLIGRNANNMTKKDTFKLGSSLSNSTINWTKKVLPNVDFWPKSLSNKRAALLISFWNCRCLHYFMFNLFMTSESPKYSNSNSPNLLLWSFCLIKSRANRSGILI